MVDASPTAKQALKVCVIRPKILQEEAEMLLQALANSYEVGNREGNFDQPLFAIDPRVFNNTFQDPQVGNYFAHPFVDHREATTFPALLTQDDIISLLPSIIKWLREYEGLNTDNLNAALQQSVREIESHTAEEKSLDGRKNLLKELIHATIEIVAFVFPEKKNDEEEEKPEITTDLPPRLKEVLGDTVDLSVSWLYAKELANSGVLTPEGEALVNISVDGKPYQLPIIPYRNFFAVWLYKLYGTQSVDDFVRKGLKLPEKVPFQARKELEAYTDSEFVTAHDVYASRAILKLETVIDQYLKSAGGGIPIFMDKTTEEKEKEQNLTKDADAAKLDELANSILASKDVYLKETIRIQNAVMPAILEQHGLYIDQANLSAEELETYRTFEKMFSAQLEMVIRDLSPEVWEKYEKGDKVGFRTEVIRNLWSKLGTNAPILDHLKQIKDNYLAKASPEKREQIERQLKSGKDFDEELRQIQYRLQANKGAIQDKWDEDEGTEQLKALAALNTLTRADLQRVLTHLTQGGITEDQFVTLFNNLDSVIAEGWGSKQILNLNIDQASRVLGIQLAADFDPDLLQKVLIIYDHYRKNRAISLGKHYEEDSIVQGKSKFLLKDDLSDEELLEFERTADLAKQLAENGGGEAVVAAKHINSEKREQINRGSNTYRYGINAAHQYFRQQRADETEQSYAEAVQAFLAASVEERKLILEQHGLFLSEQFANQQDLDRFYAEQYQLLVDSDRAADMAAIDDLSDHQFDQGAVTDETGNVQGYGRGDQKARSLLNGLSTVRNRFGQFKNNFDRAKKGVKAAGQAFKKTFDAIEKVAALPLGPVGRSKNATRLTYAGAAFAAARFLTGSPLTQLMTLGLGTLSGAVGGFFFGVPGAITGFVGGSVVGATASALIEGVFGKGAVTINAPSGLTPSLFGGAGGQGASQASISQFALPTYSSGATFVQSATLVTGVTALIAVPALTGGQLATFLPPDFETVDLAGNQSKYVTITKTSDPKTLENFTDAASTKPITYTITVQPKLGYKIDITGLQDVLTVVKKSETGPTPPTPAGCEVISFDNLQDKVVEADETQVIGTCTINVNQQYNDSGIQNEFLLNFTASNEAESVAAQVARTLALTCVGKCPQFESGGWPVTGRLTQGPFSGGDNSHSIAGFADALDIGANAGTPVYATFPGTAEYYVGDSQLAEQKGVYPTYGNHVVIKTANGFALLYGHLLKFSTNPQTGQAYVAGDKVTVQKCTLLGFVGMTGGNSSGNHLHYEYRTISGIARAGTIGTKTSVIGTILPDPFNRLSYKDAVALRGTQVTTDCK